MSKEKIEAGGGHVAYWIESNGTAHCEFYHPQSNSLPGELLRTLAATIEKLGEHDAVKVIVLRGHGDRAFCAGASFDELISIKDLDEGKHFFMGFATVINAMRKCPKFIVGRVHGKAVGGAVGLAASADYTFATQHSAAKLSELAIGIGPFVVGPAVQRKIGTAAFAQMSMAATEWNSPQWAKDKGLYQEVFESTDTMDEAIENLCDKLAGYNPDAMRELKMVYWRGTEDWDVLLDERAAISGRLVMSKFTRDAIEKFKQKAKK